MSFPQPIEFKHLGRKPFAEVLELQFALRKKRQAEEIRDTVLFVEHPKVITRGRRPAEEDFLVEPEELKRRGFHVADASRGGRLTYHGPGQLVAYFIVDIQKRGWTVPAFVRRVEEAAILCLKSYALRAERRCGFPGVWIQSRKIVSVGLALDRGVSMNGIALNVDPELADFAVIVPCGIHDGSMTSLKREMGEAPSLDRVAAVLERCIGEVFESEFPPNL